MKIVAHRGIWVEEKEQNSMEAFKKALDSGFGIELDVRDHNGQIGVSHDMITNDKFLDFELVVELFSHYESILAINIKSDGMLKKIETILQELDTEKFFCFDMSIPESIPYLESQLPTYMRISEFEEFGPLHAKSAGVWLDSFYSDWWRNDLDVFVASKNYCVVSPELHHRDNMEAWNFLNKVGSSKNIYLCTDQPKSAIEFFT